MWIKQFRIQSFSSFDDSGWVPLAKDFNLVIGINNSGKTALLRALAPAIENTPHRNKVRYRDFETMPSTIDFDVSITISELYERASSTGTGLIVGACGNTPSINDFFTGPDQEVVLEASRTAGQSVSSRENAAIRQLRGGSVPTPYNVTYSEGRLRVSSNSGNVDNLCYFIDNPASEAIFYFGPQRLNIAEYSFGQETRLRPDAGNLPSVLADLQAARRPTFEKIVQLLSSIVPSVQSVAVVPKQSVFQIVTRPDASEDARELAFSLKDSGTGVGQLLAILTAVVTTRQSVIIIDELNNFLHPAACKRLISIFRSEFPHHQYIISTHSAEAVSALASSQVLLVEKDEYDSSVSEISLTRITSIRRIASLLGISLMDVFGFERIIWVEGETEQICFPWLLTHFGYSVGSDIGFCPVLSTSEFDRKLSTKKSITDLYDEVAVSVSPLVLGMAFGLDREKHSDEMVQSLERSRRKLKLLPRRCLENYLLHPEAIARYLCQIDDSAAFTAPLVQEFLIQNGGDRKYGAASLWKSSITDIDWLRRVDAASLLSDCVKALSRTRHEYNKTRDALSILQALVSIDENQVRELLTYIRKLVEVAGRDSKT